MIFYIITMKTKQGKKLYLDLMTGSPTWSFNIGEACYFQTYKQAEEFSKNWFKNFDNWEVEEYERVFE